MLPDKLDAFGWGGSIPNNISQTADLICTDVIDISKDGLKSIYVGMDI